MNDLIKRNMPVIVIGFVTLAIFIVIIAMSSRATPVRPNLEEYSNSELYEEHTYFRGNEDAIVTVIEFSDFQCPACAAAHPNVKAIINKYEEDVRLGYRHLPLPQHQHARLAAQAAQAAGLQGKFWEYHDVLFNNQENLEEQFLLQYAEDLGLDVARFTADMNSEEIAREVQTDLEAARGLAVRSTPTFIINGSFAQFRSYQELDQLIAEEIERARVEQNPDLEATGTSTNEETEEFTPPVEEVELDYSAIDESRGTLEITFSEEGFDPKQTDALSGQLVSWTNTTDRTITIVETASKFAEFEVGVSIEPGETYEYRLSKDRLWTYKEEESGKFGAINITKPVEVRLLPTSN